MNPLQTALVAGALTLASAAALWAVKTFLQRAGRARHPAEPETGRGGDDV